MAEIEGLFKPSAVSVGVRAPRVLVGSTQVTELAMSVAKHTFEAALSQPDVYQARILASQTDIGELESLIVELGSLDVYDTTFIKNLGDENTDGILKSQMSKRSRCKGKEMTSENYLNMMTAMAAELLVRKEIGKKRSATVSRRSTATYSEDELKQLAADQNALRREIRNVQSKKSMHKKSLNGIEPTMEDLGWKLLCDIEDQLKSIRTDIPRGSFNTLADNTRTELAAKLEGVNLTELGADEAKDLLMSLAQLATPKAVTEPTVIHVPDDLVPANKDLLMSVAIEPEAPAEDSSDDNSEPLVEEVVIEKKTTTRKPRTKKSK